MLEKAVVISEKNAILSLVDFLDFIHQLGAGPSPNVLVVNTVLGTQWKGVNLLAYQLIGSRLP